MLSSEIIISKHVFVETPILEAHFNILSGVHLHVSDETEACALLYVEYLPTKKSFMNGNHFIR